MNEPLGTLESGQGEALGHYRILERIGAGPLGEVYRARDTRLGRTVAVKVPGDDIQSDGSRREAFSRVARASLALSHPNIATLYEIADEQGKLFLVFEFAPGETLKQVIAGLPMNPRRAVDLAAQIADALADAHATDIVHGNLDADGIIVTPKGNAKILDFGFGRWTQAGSNDARSMDERADVLALGALFFEMLTGERPVPGAPPPNLNPSSPPELVALASKMIQSAGDPPAAATAAAELRSVAAILDVRATSEPIRIAPARRPHKPREPVILAVAILVLSALAAAVWLLF